ncbi:MAG: hypothetical protein Fur0046_15120 [Cyanobacteria bacterium J069]|nr:MAG: hypothetical protein D6742_08110 [Cyanobacteria bacterium J069]
MTEADLVLAKAFLLFSVAGYTITAANIHPQPLMVSQAATNWIAAQTGSDRPTLAPTVLNLTARESAVAQFPLHLGKPPALFAQSPASASAAIAPDRTTVTLPFSAAASLAATPSPVKPPSPQLSDRATPLVMPPKLVEAGFQFQL